MERAPELVSLTEYIQDVLYFGTVRPGKSIKSTAETHYFSIDEKLLYENYYSDFGPLNLSCVYKYCKILNDKFKMYLNQQRIVHYASNDPRKKANAAFLLGCYGVLYLNLTPQEALKPLFANNLSFRPFQDAVQGDSCYTITILDCLNAIKKAKEHGFFNFQDFDCAEYDRLDKIQGGDLNWIIPGKYLAFIGPVDYNCGTSLYHPPEIYLDYFLENNVMIVIRLNKRFYDGKVFTNVGIQHYDLFFPDGSCPPRHILIRFLQLSEENPDCAIAVHCKAGLGRTGSLIGCYLIKHYRMSAREAIAWMRICRPGSVIGHQQGWLEQMEPWLQKQGNNMRKRIYNDPDKYTQHVFGIYSIVETRARNKRSERTSQAGSPKISRTSSPSKLHRSLTPNSAHTSPTLHPNPSKTKDGMWKSSEASRASSGSCASAGTTRSSDGKLQSDWRSMKSYSGYKLSNEVINNQRSPGEMPHMLYRRAPGAGGEPRSSQSPTRQSRRNDLLREQTEQKNRGCAMAQIRNQQSAKNMEEAKNALFRSSYHLRNSEQQRRSRKNLEAAVTVAPFGAENSEACIDNLLKYRNGNTSPEPNTATSRQPRKSLGRSPSPQNCLSRQVSQRSTTTSTHAVNIQQQQTEPAPKKSSVGTQKPSALQQALYKLQTGMQLARERSAGAASLGAGSLGARREAPPGLPRQHVPSARSDDRARATQGDLLNSIKFERRMREAEATAKKSENTASHSVSQNASKLSATRTRSSAAKRDLAWQQNALDVLQNWRLSKKQEYRYN